MTEEANFEELKCELEKVRSEFGQLRTDMLNERVNRAEQHLGYIRNWLAIYTPIVTLVFLGFALLGYRGYSDIQASRERVDAEAAKVQKTAQDFSARVEEANQKLESFSAKEKHFEEVAAENETVVGGIKGSVVTLRSSLAGLNGQYQDMQSRTSKLETQLKATSTLATQTSLDTTGLRGAFRDYSMGQPTLLLSAFFMLGKSFTTTIDGANLGSAPGHLYVRVQELAYPVLGWRLLDNKELSPDNKELSPIEIEKQSIYEWKDSGIKFVLSSSAESALQEAKSQLGARSQLPGALGPVLAFQVETADGKKSLWTPSIGWPILPYK